MEKGKRKNKQVIIGINVLLLVTLLLLGLTYAYYRTRIIGNSNSESISVTSKKLEVTYKDGESSITTEEKISPGFTASKEFDVKNTGDETTSYGIVLEKIINDFDRKEDWTYKLKRITGTTPETETLLTTGQIGDTTEEGKPQYIYLKDTVNKGETNKYKLEIFYADSEDDQSKDMNKHLSFKVNIADAKTIFDYAIEGTLLSKIGETVEENNDDNPTIPGRQPSREDEAYIGETEDDYGISYYYRGKVTNNYLNFGGMCWRIVRVQGNGSIKIVLADGTHTCNDPDFQTGKNGSAFIATSQAFNRQNSAKENARYDQSEIKEKVEQWFGDQEKIMTEIQYIDEDAEWCVDMSESSTESSTIVYTYFGARDRLDPPSGAKPNLKCDFVGKVEGTESKAEKYKKGVGLLSADEVAFAGSTYLQNDHTYYLIDNTNNIWWTLSPCYFRSDGAGVWFVNSTGSMSSYTVNNGYSVRPALVLKPGTPISDQGDGTQGSPYEVNTQ